MNKRVNPCPLFTNFPYLPCTIDHDLRFFGFSLQGTENQDKTGRAFMLNMIGNLVWGNGDPFTFRYFQLDCKNSPIVSKTQQIRNTLRCPRFYPNPFELWQMFLNLFPKVCFRGSQSNYLFLVFIRYVYQYAHKFDKMEENFLCLKQGV